jgi:hypothetical protein
MTMWVSNRLELPPADIAVTLVDAASGDVVDVTELPADSLPSTFGDGVEMAVGDREWRVLRAEPPTRAEYERTGALRLMLRQIQRIDPRRLRYSMSSICDALPPVEQVLADAGEPGLILP